MNPKLYYLNHSGFLLELEKALLVFDFYTDPAGVLASYNLSNKPAVFSYRTITLIIGIRIF